MSPEQALGESIDPRSDLYALGAVAYFLLTGQPVFEGATVFAIVHHHLQTEPTPPSRRVAQPIPAALEAIVMQCLEKKLDARPASAAALRLALRSAGVPRWTTDDAAGWWQRFRSEGTHVEQPVSNGEGHGLTVAVDVDERLTQAISL